MRGIFIPTDILDESGKKTQVKLLKERSRCLIIFYILK